MADFLDRLVARGLGHAPTLVPRLPALFESPGDNRLGGHDGVDPAFSPDEEAEPSPSPPQRGRRKVPEPAARVHGDVGSAVSGDAPSMPLSGAVVDVAGETSAGRPLRARGLRDSDPASRPLPSRVDDTSGPLVSGGPVAMAAPWPARNDDGTGDIRMEPFRASPPGRAAGLEATDRGLARVARTTGFPAPPRAQRPAGTDPLRGLPVGAIEPTEQPTVRVSIGRVEVRAIVPALTAMAPVRSEAAVPRADDRPTLADFLRGNDGRPT